MTPETDVPAIGDDDASAQGPDLHEPQIHALLESYWRKNVIVTIMLLALWAIAGIGCGVIFADKLNQFHLFGSGLPLGFWFAHQGSIMIFVLLILLYCLILNRLDAKHHEDLKKIRNGEQ